MSLSAMGPLPPPPPPRPRSASSKYLEIFSVLDSSRSFSISPEPDKAPPLKRFSFDASSYVVKREGYAATDPIALDGVAPNNTTEQSQDREETVPADNNTQNANMAPPKTKTEAEKKAQRAKKARERRERKKANAKFATDAAAADAQELTPAPSGRATETPQPLDDLMNASLGQNGKKRAYDVTHAGAKVVTGAKKVSRKRAAPDSPPAQAEDSADYENDDDQEDDDTDLSDFDHLTELIDQVTTLKLERIEQDIVDEKAEKKYNLAKRLYQAGTLNKKAFDVKAKKCETSLEIGIAAHEARKVKLIALENDVDKEFRRIATRMLVANDSAGNILEDFQDLSMYNRCGFLRTGNEHQQRETQRQQKETRESRIEALADFWTLGLGRDSKDFDKLARSLTRKVKGNTHDKNQKK